MTKADQRSNRSGNAPVSLILTNLADVEFKPTQHVYREEA